MSTSTSRDNAYNDAAADGDGNGVDDDDDDCLH